MIGIVDFDAGNLQSVKNALDRIKIKYFVSSQEKELKKAVKIIFPGVGHAKSAMENLNKRNLINFLQTTKQPFLGICLGMQLMLDYSEEGDTKCLGIFKGKVKKFSFPLEKKVPIPHMGWNEVKILKKENIFKNILQNLDFYFVHSYFCQLEKEEEILSSTNLAGFDFCSSCFRDNFFGLQFHPEKSSQWGEKVLQNFCLF